MPSPLRRTLMHAPYAAFAFVTFTLLLAGGCASPGPPRPPSLNLPGAVTDLTVLRHGDNVDLRFTIPQRNTDRLPLRGGRVRIGLCRALGGGACLPLAGSETVLIVNGGRPNTALLHDFLSKPLNVGGPRALLYRVQLFNVAGKTAGFSDPAFTVAGEAPPPVEGFAASGSRLGVLLSWQGANAGEAPSSSTGSIAIRREELAPKAPLAASFAARRTVLNRPSNGRGTEAHGGATEPDTVVLAAPEPDPYDRLLDTSAALDEPYRYSAERRRSVQIGGRRLEIRSESSAAVVFELHDMYPPPAPADLTAAAFPVNPGDPASAMAVDLIWQPVDDLRLLGYIVYRQILDASGAPIGTAKRLTQEAVRLPAFHDKLDGLSAPVRLRYSVIATDAKGNESGPAITSLDVSR